MSIGVRNEMERVVDGIFGNGDVKELLHAFMRDKAGEQSRWSSLTLHAHYMLGGNSPHIERAAALTELIILALDIVDDLQDQDNMDKPWMKCPLAYSLNAVLALLAAMTHELGTIGSARLSGEIGRLLARAIEGQQMDVSQSVHSEADYVTMVQMKSGSLIRLACCMGYALIDGLEQETIDRMNDLADCIGMIAQIANDVNDLQRYDVKNDLLQKKRTLPILFLLVDSEAEFPAIPRFYAGEMTADEFLKVKKECLQYIQESGCIEYSEVIRTLYAEKAEQLFDALPAVSPWKEKFKEIAFG